MFLAPYGRVVVRLSRDAVWMTPLGDALLFLTAAGGLLLVGRMRPAATSRPAVVGTFAGLTALSLGFLLERIHPVAVVLLATGVGVQVGRMTRRPPRFPRLMPVLTVGAFLVVGGLTARMELGERSWRHTWLAWLPPPPADAPNVLLLILDTVRGASLDFVDDAAPASEWPPVRPPVMDSLAGRSVVFSRAFAPSPWTLPSHASMFTGRWPMELWGRSGLGAAWVQGLDARYPTVAETLARDGYLTAGFVGNLVFTSAETGLNRGFLEYRDYPVSASQIFLSTAIGRRLAGSTALRSLIGYHEVLDRKDASRVADEFLDWERRHGDRPWFAFLNFFDAHEPYFPPDSVKRALPPGSRWDDFDHFAGLLTGSGALRADKWTMTPEERAAHASGYDGAILRIDAQIGRILDELRARGRLDKTVVILTSDHGEQLGEHGLYDHNNSLYTQALHVPLLVHDPRRQASSGRVNDLVTLKDVGATIVDLVGLRPDSAGIAGTSLARYWGERTPSGGAGAADPVSPDTVLSTLERGSDNRPWYPVSWGPAMYSLVDSTWHYIRNGDGSEELYDLAADPAEEHDLRWDPGAPPLLESFRRTLEAMVPRLPPVRTAPVRHPAPPDPPGGD